MCSGKVCTPGEDTTVNRGHCVAFKGRLLLSMGEMLVHSTAIGGFAESVNEMSDVTVIASVDPQGCIDNLSKTEEDSCGKDFSLFGSIRFSTLP